MSTYFIVATEKEIAEMASVDDVLAHMSKVEPIFGGISLAEFDSLSRIFLQGEDGKLKATNHFLADGSTFYLIDKKLCETIASTDWDDLLQASVAWSEAEPWKSKEHNRMDLAGMIIDIANLCKQAGDEKSLYILSANEE